MKKSRKDIVTPKKAVAEQKKPFSLNDYFREKRYVLIPLAVSFLLYLIIRSLYPIPDFTADSRMYIFGAIVESELSYRPLGYSSLLKAIHNLSPDISTVAFIQYFAFAGCTIFFTKTCATVFNFNKTIKAICYSICLINFPFIYLANSMMTDSFFISLTLLWITCLIKLIYKYDWISNVIMILVFWGLLFIRYNALIYPVFALIAIVFFMKNIKLKIANVVVIAAVTLSFYFTIKNRVESETGANVLSGFSGWQLATNAYNVHKLIKDGSLKNLSEESSLINAFCTRYNDSLKKVGAFKSEYDFGLLWHDDSPFKQYQKLYQQHNNIFNDFEGWTKISIPLNDYAVSIIKQYPMQYASKYIIPNAGAYVFPEIEMLASYQLPSLEIVRGIQQYYGLPQKVTNTHIDLPATLNTPYRLLFGLTSVGFLLTIIIAVGRRKRIKTFNISTPTIQVSLVIAAFYFVKMFFDVLAAPIVYRYIAMNLPLMLCFICFWGVLVIKGNSYRLESGK